MNHVFRDSVYPPVEGTLTSMAEEMFEREVTVPMLDPDELYASKLVATLDRQHPRDLFYRTSRSLTKCSMHWSSS
ncbi:MAG: nucleotidyl transferase AbiEii/AbiGii toxin family protein [Desulfuromusa sp.]|nr:nucleotidyl transferase AbiEii/AbiGii toxin family protein [Desulfuromusa sp.]